MNLDYTQTFSADVHAMANAEGLHYLVQQGVDYLILAGYLSPSKFLEVASVFELTVMSQWLAQMPRDIMMLEEPSTAVRNVMALAMILIIGEGDPQISMQKIMTACINLQEYIVLELEFRQLGLMDSLENARKHYTVLER